MMVAKFGPGQKVAFVTVLNENGNKKYPIFEQYVGKVGTVIDSFNVPHIVEDLIEGRDMGEPEACYVYAIRVGSEKLEAVPEEYLVATD